MSKQVSAEDWYSKSHAEIYAAGQALLSGYPQTTQEIFHNKAQQLREAMRDDYPTLPADPGWPATST